MDIKKSLLIYVVEDNLIFNTMVCQHLKNQNFTNIKSFVSGKECMRAVFKGENPDIVIQDYFLDDSNGIDVLKAVKSKCKTAEFIFLTANKDIEVAIDCIRYGVSDYIIKDKEDVLKRVVNKVNKVSAIIQIKKKERAILVSMLIMVMVLSIIIITGLLLYFFGVIVRG